MSPLGSHSFRFFREFRCPGCLGQKAYRSRYRGILEQVFLFLLLLKPVRCERCFHRTYIFRTVPALEPGAAVGRVDNQSSSDASAGTRVA